MQLSNSHHANFGGNLKLVITNYISEIHKTGQSIIQFILSKVKNVTVSITAKVLSKIDLDTLNQSKIDD